MGSSPPPPRLFHPTWRMWLLFSVLFAVDNAAAKPGLCEVESGQSNVIMDIEESRGSQMNQATSPPELPIVGDPFKEVALDLVFPKGAPVFILNGKNLQLLSPLDRDKDNLSHIVFQLICTIRSTRKVRTIPVIVRVSDINDNAPKFINTPYETTVAELTPVGTTIFRNVKAEDSDTGVNSLVEYMVVPGDEEAINTANNKNTRIKTADGYRYFSINLPHQGQVTVNRSLDYERMQRYFVTILATDRARNTSERLSSSTTLIVKIRDDDDQEPSFVYQGCMLLEGACINPEYSSTVSAGKLSGVLNISPEKIQAVDMDSINAPIQYSFLSGSPETYKKYFEINPTTGAVKQIQPVDSGVATKFNIIVKAAEVSEAQRFTTAKLVIIVKPVDSHPPEIKATATEGYVDENAPIGTQVVDSSGNPISLAVTDADLGPDDPKPQYTFELTTNFFRMEKNILVVNEENLDRDPPSPGKFRFQVVARERDGSAASAPLSLVVTLNDVNDNAPILKSVPPISVQAGEARREIVKVEATDSDLGENAIVSYNIFHVSNNGRSKFTIDRDTGLIEAIGKLAAGEQYSITVEAKDRGDKSSQTIVEVSVVPGPNTRPPVFQQHVYEVQVSEGAALNTTVATIVANDPENDPVSYSIVSGNDLRQFAINPSSGVINIIRKLDREDLTRYQLLIRAEDSGGLSSTATVNIKVTDINDKNPEFVGLPYVFHVREGVADQMIGTVHADDADEGQNAVVHYSVPEDIPFAVNSTTGEIKTVMALDFEKQREYRFVVTARDGALDPRLATATVTVEVEDIEDEVPIFKTPSYEARVPENVPDFMVAQVKAEDPDTTERITYTIRQGPTDLFTIDPQTGIIHTIRGLDYERENQYILVVGTLENSGNGSGATTRVSVNVEDRNDIPPVFITVPRPVTIEDDVSIGTRVTTLTATDSDGTAPGNKVRYELIGRGKASKYFQIDPDSGVLQVRDDLRKETESEYQVDIKAYDLGEPQLSSVTAVQILVKHSATVAPEIGLGWADDFYTVEIPEDTPPGTLLKSLTVINSAAHRSSPAPLRCLIVGGNEDDLVTVPTEKGHSQVATHHGFHGTMLSSDWQEGAVIHQVVNSKWSDDSQLWGLNSSNVCLDALVAQMTEERNCEIRLAIPLDHEKRTLYTATLKLDTLAGLVNPTRTHTKLKVQVVDINDNTPKFIFPPNRNETARGRYFGAVTADVSISTSILQVKAEDRDSGSFGKIQYALLGSTDSLAEGISNEVESTTDWFTLDSDTGVLKTRRTMEDAPPENLPFKLWVEARDNPDHPENSNKAQAEVIINMISPRHLLVLAVMDAKPDKVQGMSENLASILEQHSGLVVGVERLTTRHFLADNSTLQSDPTGTDLWFYAVDPDTGIVLDHNSTRVQRSILDKAASSNITLDVSTALQATATGIREPLSALQPRAVIAASLEIFPYAIIIIACIILVLGIVGIIYICVSWARYKAYKERTQRMYVPRYDPVIVEPNLKEYETQVLQMSVPLDDSDSYNDLQIDFSHKNHVFSMDNVSYITKENNLENAGSRGQQSPASSDAATTARASSIAGGSGSGLHKPNNTVYDRSDGENMGSLNASTTNENVLFREKKDYSHMGFSYLNDRNSIETTTEL